MLERDKLSDDDKQYLHDVFIGQVFPVLSPLAIDPAHPFPFIPNTGFSLALQLERKSDKRRLQRPAADPASDRPVRVAAGTGWCTTGFCRWRICWCCKVSISFIRATRRRDISTFRVLRDSDLEVEDEAEDLVREFEVALKRRRRGEVVRMTHQHRRARSSSVRSLWTSCRSHPATLIEIDGHDRYRGPQRTGAERPTGSAVAQLHTTCTRAGAGP